MLTGELKALCIKELQQRVKLFQEVVLSFYTDIILVNVFFRLGSFQDQ
jgi:hypothetical protein